MLVDEKWKTQMKWTLFVCSYIFSTYVFDLKCVFDSPKCKVGQKFSMYTFLFKLKKEQY